MNKRILSIILVLSMLVGMLAVMPMTASAATTEVWDGSVASSFAGGDGTEGNPYQIANGAQLALMADKITNQKDGNYNRAHYVLTADIVLNDMPHVSTWYDGWYDGAADAYEPANMFTPIGTWSSATSSFGGTFDGANHTITGAYFYAEEGDNHGLFGAIQGGAVIKNFALVNSLFGNEAGNIAAIAGTTDRNNEGDILIENIYVDAYVYAGGANAGGIMGTLSNTQSGYDAGVVTMKNVTFTGAVEGTNYAAGLIADARNVVFDVDDCLVYANIKATNGQYSAGFVARSNNNLDLLEKNYAQVVTNCILAGGNVTASKNTKYNRAYISSSSGTNKPLAEYCYNAVSGLSTMKNADTDDTNAPSANIDVSVLYGSYTGTSNVNWSTLTNWARPAYDIARPKGIAENFEILPIDPPKDFENGEGTKADPFEISNAAELAKLSANSQTNSYADVYFELTADITLTGENNHQPIGSWASAFGGNFDGNGHTISGVHIKNTGDGSGFFAAIQGGATIKNLALVDAYIESTTAGAIGALVGQTNRGSTADITISNVYVEATVVAVGNEVAGIIGNLSDGYESGTVNLTNVVFNGSVKATGNYVAGIVGNSRDVTVNLEGCAVYGSVETNGNYVAGLISGQSGIYSINNCVVAASIMGNEGTVAVAYSTKDKTDGERSITNTYYVNGIAADGATKRADGGADITVLDSISDLINASVIDGWTARTNDAPVPSAVSTLVENDVLLKAQLEYGASVRIDTSSAKTTGIRWTAIVSKPYLASLGENYTLGMIIAPVDYIKGDFTIAELEKLDIETTKYKNVVAETIVDENSYVTFACALGGIQKKNLGREFASRIYVLIDGEYYYFGYNEASNARSVAYVAGAAFNDYSETQDDEYAYEVATGNSTVYSPYTEAQRNTLADYMFTADSTLATGASVRVMSLNILSDEYGDKLPVDGRDLAVEAIINEYRPAVIGLQETSANWYSSIKNLYNGTTYNICEPKCNSNFWDSLFGTGENYLTTIMYDSTQVSFVDSGVKEYSAERITQGNMIFWAKFTDKSENTFVVINTHWDINQTDYAENRAAQAEELAAFIETFDCPVIALGDFNTKTGDALFSDNGYEGDNATLNSARFIAETVITDWSYYDHIFGNSGVSFKAYNAIKDNVVEGASDHKPIYADIAFN